MNLSTINIKQMLLQLTCLLLHPDVYPSTLDVHECTQALNPIHHVQLYKHFTSYHSPLMDWKVSKISPDKEENSLSNTTIAFFLLPSHLVTQRHMMFLNSFILGWTTPLSLNLINSVAICSLIGSMSPDTTSAVKCSTSYYITNCIYW